MTDIETRYGLFQTPAAESDMITRFLRRYGEWARNEVRFVAEALPEGPIRVLDIGAFIGTFGIGLSAERAMKSLCFVEANPAVAPALRQNVERNAKAPATVVEAALVPDGAPRTGNLDPDNLGSLSFASEPEGDGQRPVNVRRFITLSELRREQGEFDLIKMDVEGLEYALLSEDKQVLEPGGPAFWLECNPTVQSLELADLLLSAGLMIHYFAFPSFALDNYRGDPTPIFPFAFEAGLWAGRGPAPKLSEALAQRGCILQSISSPEELRQALWRTPRWGAREWEGASLEAMVAEAGHLHEGEVYAEFLRPDVPRFPEHIQRLGLHRSRELLLEHEYALKRRDEQNSILAESLARSQSELKAAYVVLDDERTRAEVLMDRLQASDDVKAVLDISLSFSEQKLAAAEQKLAAAEQKLAAAEQKAQTLHGAEQRLHAMELSTTWRASRLVRAFFVRHPRVRMALRSILAKIYRPVRRLLRGPASSNG